MASMFSGANTMIGRRGAANFLRIRVKPAAMSDGLNSKYGATV
jgi:hypothetical protein